MLAVGFFVDALYQLEEASFYYHFAGCLSGKAVGFCQIFFHVC